MIRSLNPDLNPDYNPDFNPPNLILNINNPNCIQTIPTLIFHDPLTQSYVLFECWKEKQGSF